MKAAFVKRKGKVEIRDVPRPEPGRGEVVLRIDACGVCGSDFIEASRWAKSWKRFGHEVAATIHAVGDGVTDFAQGDKAVMALSVPCGECEACRNGRFRYCSGFIVAEQGGFAEYLLVKDVRLLRAVSHATPSNVACLVEPLTVILEAFRLARLEESDRLFVVGGGFLGALAVLTASVMGVPVAGAMSRRLGENVRMALELTEGEFVKWSSLGGMAFGPPSAFRAALSGHPGRVVVLHTAPPSMIGAYIDALPYAATVVNIGLSDTDKGNRFTLDAAGNVFRRTQVLSAFPVPCLYLEDAVSMLEEHVEIFSRLKTHTISLDALPGLIASRPRGGKTIVAMGE